MSAQHDIEAIGFEVDGLDQMADVIFASAYSPETIIKNTNDSFRTGCCSELKLTPYERRFCNK